jgi:hypothetical protein
VWKAGRELPMLKKEAGSALAVYTIDANDGDLKGCHE